MYENNPEERKTGNRKPYIPPVGPESQSVPPVPHYADLPPGTLPPIDLPKDNKQ